MIAVDLARTGSDLTVVTMPGHRMRSGERLFLIGSPNAVRHHVDLVFDQSRFSITTYRRPSNGYRRHLRRAKARARI